MLSAIVGQATIAGVSCYDRSSITLSRGPMGKLSITTPNRSSLRLFLAVLILLWGELGRAQAPGMPLLLPSGIAYGASGNLYFAETSSHLVRCLTPLGMLSVVAGTGTQGYAGDAALATEALLDSPTAVALDAGGNLFIADTHNHRVRRVDATSGLISTYALAGLPVALAFNLKGELAYADAAAHQVLVIDSLSGKATVMAGDGRQGYAGDGALATAASLDTPSGIAYDPLGNLFIADAHNHAIRRVDAVTHTIAPVAGTGEPGFSGDQSAATTAQLDLPRAISFDGSGNLLIADSRNQRVRRVDASSGMIATVVGDGTQGFLRDGLPATSASLNSPRSVTFSPSALLTLADSGNGRLRRVDLLGDLQTVAGIGAITPGRISSATTLALGESATLTSTVSAPGSAPTGTATLTDGTTAVAVAALTGGTANFAMGVLSTGSHTLTAVYSGNSALLPSTSQPLILTISSPAASDFTLAVTGASSITTVAGSAATFTFAIAVTGAPFTSPINLSALGHAERRDAKLQPGAASATFWPCHLHPDDRHSGVGAISSTEEHWS